MRSCLPALWLASFGAMAFATDAEFIITAPRTMLVAPTPVAGDSLFEAKIEPTKHDLRLDPGRASERWEQNFQFAARLPVAETFSLRQEFRAGLQNETVLGGELSVAFRDALSTLEKTSAELRVGEALILAASVQDQWLATNSVPFAEIVTYGAEVKFTPVKTTVVKLQLEWSEREEFAATESGQETYRLALEQELVPKRLSTTVGGALGHADDATFAEREVFTRKVDGSLKWMPLADTALTLGGERRTRAADSLVDATETVALKFQQQLFARSKVELQAGYELHTRSPLDAATTADSAWNLGASSDFALREAWQAGVGVRYRLREDAASAVPGDELSLSLSVKGQF